MKRFLYLFVLIAVTLSPATGADKPNIVFFMADDLGWNDVGYHGSEIRTPNIDRLAAKGVELDRYYAFPVCSPTRAALMTARSPIVLGIDSPVGPNGGLPLDEHLLPQTLQAAGYQTMMVGKWHLGIERAASHPHNRGFEHSYGHLGPAVDYFTHIWGGGLDWHRNGKVLREEGYSTELIAAEAARLVKNRDKSRPIFLYVAFNSPHTPLQATERYLDNYANIRDGKRQLFAAMVDAMDAGVGAVLDALEQEGMTANTLVVWVSDNGGNLNAGASNKPFRSGKGTTFEGGIRVPGLIYWPGVIESGKKFSQQFTAHDWMPTLTAAVGVEMQSTKPLHGINMWPALKDGKMVERGDTVIGVDGNYTVFHDGWKLVEYTPRSQANTSFHLFRIEDDPNEQHDFAGQKPEMVKELLALIRKIPRAQSVSRDLLPRQRQEGARGKAGGKRKGVSGRRGGRRDPRAGWPEETREPWVEAALRD